MTVRLHINIDHVATLRQARGTQYPDPIAAARIAEAAGAHGITVHLREDRRHIQDGDVTALRKSVTTVMNLEMAATAEMVRIARQVRPDVVTLVPERREERTTEGGLDVVAQRDAVARAVSDLRAEGIRVNLFIDPNEPQVVASKELGAQGVELHTGDFAHGAGGLEAQEIGRLAQAAARAKELGLDLAAGHGLTVANTETLVRAVPQVEELNIGHAVVADAVFLGLEGAVKAFLGAIERGMRDA
ncbi:MAG: pyridoxine 5'-phosphate synthase [Polyangiales bacterium]